MLNENILEYQLDSNCNTFVYTYSEKYIASSIDKWLFPKKIYNIPTGIKMWFPENTITLVTICPWLSRKIKIVSQAITHDGDITIQVQNVSCLPIKILKEQILAGIHIIPKTECHVIEVN